MKLGLGTVQLGLDYGISNAGGKSSRDEARAILRCAAEAGITVLDTAPAYGESEAVIGDAGAAPFRVVTKTAAHVGGSDAEGCAQALEQTLHRSLTRLRAPRVGALLEHDPRELMGACGAARFARMARLRDEGLVEKIGASVYRGEQLHEVLARHPIEIVQLPVNVLDQRLLRSGALEDARARGVEIHARSAFLQGLLLMEPEMLPRSLAAARPALVRLRERAAEMQCSPLALALGFVLALPEIDVVVCGVNDRAQLDELLRVSEIAVDPARLADLAAGDAPWLDPSSWPARE